MEVSDVRRRLTAAIDRARRESQDRRQRIAAAEKAYDAFLSGVAVPLFRMLANALTAEGLPFNAATPGGEVRLASETNRIDFIELALDTTGAAPEVVARISRSRGSRTLTDERPLRAGAQPDAITQEDLLVFMLAALEPWLQK